MKSKLREQPIAHPKVGKWYQVFHCESNCEGINLYKKPTKEFSNNFIMVAYQKLQEIPSGSLVFFAEEANIINHGHTVGYQDKFGWIWPNTRFFEVETSENEDTVASIDGTLSESTNMNEENEKVAEGNYGSHAHKIKSSRQQIPQGFKVKDLVAIEILWYSKLESVDTDGKFIENKDFLKGNLSGMIVRKDHYDTWVDVLIGEEVLHLDPSDFSNINMKKMPNP